VNGARGPVRRGPHLPAAVDDLVQLMGMFHGYLRDSPLALERTLRDLRSAPLNYSNDRLHAADGALVLMDQEVRHVVSSRLT
jgi:acyl-CoA dehydrogenase